MRVAIIGSGISGLAAAHRLRRHAHVTLFESGQRFGGHSHTVDITLPAGAEERSCGVDTGFLVFNERTYPKLIELFGLLGVATTDTDMSFSVQVPRPGGAEGLEWSGSDLFSVFAQPRNLLSPAFLGMLADLLRFNRTCTRLAEPALEEQTQESLQQFLDRHRFGPALRDWYLLPMLGCIWSCPTDQMLRFPVATMIRFCHNHGLLQVHDRPKWRTVTGGARHYVDKIVQELPDARRNCPVWRIERFPEGVRLHSARGVEFFDHVVVATHSDQALALLEQPSPMEARVLGAIRYQPNRAVLHTDTSVLPRRKAAWAAWNYERAIDPGRESSSVCVHYLLNQLQPLPFDQPVIETLNPVRPIAPEHVLGEYEYHHPVFDLTAIEAQRSVPLLQGEGNAWFCGAWTGYGFHEDGLKSGYAAADALLARVGVEAGAYA